MVKSNIFWIITFIITGIISIFLKDISNKWYLLPIIYTLCFLAIYMIVRMVTDGDYRLIQINKVKKVKHPQSDKYYFTITSNNIITLFRSHLFYNKYINYFYIDKKEASIKQIKEELNYYIKKDLPISVDYQDFYKEVNNWSGALSDDLERDDKIKNILK